METLTQILYYLLPLLGVVFLTVGILKEQFIYFLASVWLSLIGLLLQYQASGWELLGSYFNYLNAFLYSINLIVLVSSVWNLLIKYPLFHQKHIRMASRIFSTVLTLGAVIILLNVWVNAFFIETDRMANTPILQVASFKPLNQCDYKYVFYKVKANGDIGFLCPNHYLVVPSIGLVDTSPNYILNHLMQQMGIKK